MKFSRIALAASLACAILAGNAYGQSLRQPASVQPTAYDYYSFDDTQPSPSDVKVEPKETEPVAAAPSACGCDSVCQSPCNSCAKSSCDPWTLFPNDNCYGIKVGGWIEGGITTNSYNPQNPPQGNGNLPVTFNYRNDELTLNQLYVYLEREIDNGGCGWDIGGRVNILYGDDYVFTQAAGLETHDDFSPHWNGRGSGIGGLSRDGIAMPQFYLDVAYNDLTARVGHFYTIMGYEVVPATGNFFYSHAYTMQYGEPFTHTGGLLIWDYNDQLDIYAGLVNGWDNFDAESDRLHFLGGVTWTSCDECTSLGFTVITGDEVGSNGRFTETRTLYSIVFSHQFTDRLQYVLQHDNGINDSKVGGRDDQEWYGINQYLFYTINDCWKAGGRFEWFRDDDGARVPGGPEGSYYEATAGLNWTPNANVIVRPEVRWDWFDGTGAPYANATRTNQFTAAIDAIFTF